MRGKGFVQLFIGTVLHMEQTLSDREKATLLSLIVRIGRRDTVVRNEDGSPMTTSCIAKAIGKSPRQTREILAGLVGAGLIVEQQAGRTKHYLVHTGLAHRFRRRCNTE